MEQGKGGRVEWGAASLIPPPSLQRHFLLPEPLQFSSSFYPCWLHFIPQIVLKLIFYLVDKRKSLFVSHQIKDEIQGPE